MHAEPQAITIIEQTGQEAANAAAHLCSLSFPWGMRWVPWSGYRKRWWYAAIHSPGSIFITAVNHEQRFLGFILLLTDEHAFKATMQTIKPTPLEKAIAIPYIPRARLAWRSLRNTSEKSEAQTSAPDRSVPRPRPRAWIEIVGVHPEARGTGVSNKLMQAADDTARRQGFSCIESKTDQRNGPALTFFFKHGYTIVDTPGTGRILSKAILPEPV